MSNSLHPMLNVAIKAARAAGALINRAALDVESVRVAQKQVNDFVTEVDQAAERIIIETLLNAYPSIPSWPKNRAASTVPRTPTMSGSSIPWTAPPTSSTASPFTA